MDLDLERWICMVLEWLAYSRIDLSLLQHQSTSQEKHASHQTFSSISLLGTLGPGDMQETLFVTCACVTHTNLQLHVHYYSAI